MSVVVLLIERKGVEGNIYLMFYGNYIINVDCEGIGITFVSSSLIGITL